MLSMDRYFLIRPYQYLCISFIILFSFIQSNSMPDDITVTARDNHNEFSINNFDNNEDNVITNSSFENYYDVEGSNWQQLPVNWEGHPSMNNMDIVLEGEDLGYGAGIFSSFNGLAGLKIWGLYDGENTENNVFQALHDSLLPSGTQFEISASVMSPGGDFIGYGDNYVVLFAKYFSSDWQLLGTEESEYFDSDNAIANEWYSLNKVCQVPDGATTVHVGIMYVQATNDDHGPVICDDLMMYLPDNEPYWIFESSDNSNSEFGFINHDIIYHPVFQGYGAMQIEYSVHNSEPFGGYSKIYHMHPDLENGGVYDWSEYNTLSLTYNNITPSSNFGTVHMRVNLSDYSEIEDPFYTGLGEYYYSFHYVLDNEPGWNTIDIPLNRTDDWEGDGFNLPGWVGENGNGTLETHSIAGFHIEFSIIGEGEGNYSDGTIILDDFGLKNIAETSPILFHSSEEYVIHGESVMVGIHIDSVTTPLSSINLSFSGFQNKMTVLDIVTNEETLMGSLGWHVEHNETDGHLITAGAGAEDIVESGRLLYIEFLVHDTLPSQTVDVNIYDYLGNENLYDYVASSGGVHVLWLPEADFQADVTTGLYPLEVVFQDSSTSGTYSIVNWAWNFGNGYTAEGQNVSTSYDYPGFYDVELTVTDEFQLSNTMIYENYIKVDTTYGDIDFNTIIDISDIQAMLDNVTGVLELDSLSIEVGDITGDNTISNLDAAISLLYLEGFISQLPPVNCCGWATASGNVVLENQNIDPGMQLEIPIIVSEGNGIYGFSGTINYDPISFSIDTIEFLDFTDNYLSSINMIDPGIIRFSAAGTDSPQDSLSFLTLSLSVSEYFSGESIISITDFQWNEEAVMDTAAEMIIGYGLNTHNASIPVKFSLYQNYPNPFNPLTTIRYDIPANNFVTLGIYDMMGKMIKRLVSQKQDAGTVSVVWDGKNTNGEYVAAGVYIYLINAGDYSQTKKMILLK